MAVQNPHRWFTTYSGRIQLLCSPISYDRLIFFPYLIQWRIGLIMRMVFFNYPKYMTLLGLLFAWRKPEKLSTSPTQFNTSGSLTQANLSIHLAIVSARIPDNEFEIGPISSVKRINFVFNATCVHYSCPKHASDFGLLFDWLIVLRPQWIFSSSLSLLFTHYMRTKSCGQASEHIIYN